MQTLRRIPYLLAVTFLIYMPFHVFLVQSLSLITGGIEIWKLFKDLLIFASVMFTICLVWWKRRRGSRTFNLLLGLGLAYAAVHLLLWAAHPGLYRNSALLGCIYNLRVPGLLLLGLGAARLLGRLNISWVLKVVLVVSTVVAGLGVVQYFLPHDILTHVGYGLERGTLPAFYIDNRPNFPRIMSTLRDPGSLGAYLILPLTLLTALAVRGGMAARRRFLLLGAVALHAVALFLTFSRGAWIAALLSVAALLGWRYRESLITGVKRYWPVIVLVFVIGSLGAFAARNTYAFKSVVTHRTGEPVGAAYDSNGFHWVFLKRGLDGIQAAPFGHGPGTAGLASIQNPAGSFLTENYYVQIGYEVGVPGLLLFLAINALVLWLLWLRRAHLLAQVLIAAALGYVVMNMLFHAWSNEAVAAQWWILAGLCIGGLTGGAESGSPARRNPNAHDRMI